MDDRLDPRFAAAVRSALLDEVRATPSPRPARAPHPAPRRPRWQPALALGIAAVTIVALAVGFTVASQTRSSAPAAVPFDGDCAAILTAHQATDLIGTPLTLRTTNSPLASPEALATSAVGGLQCVWAGDGDAADEAGITLTVLPVALRPKDAKAASSCDGENEGKDEQYFCTVDVVAGGRWITGFLTGLTGGTNARTATDVADLRRTIEALPAAETTTRLDTTGWWSPVACAALGKRADLPAALGHPGLRTETGNGGMRSAGEGAAVDRAVVVNCILEADTDSDTPFEAELHAVAGAGAAITERMEGSQVRRLADVGEAKVYRVADETSKTSTLWVVAAGGALELSPPYGDDARTMLPAVAPLLQTLDAHVRK